MADILIVEDSEEYSKLLVRTMSDHKTVCSGTVDDALIQLRNRSFDLILLDITLPGRSGYELLSEMQSIRLDEPTPVICLTGRTEVTDKVTAFSMGVEDYVVKPFDPIELRARVESKLKKSSRRRDERVTQHDGLEVDHDRHRVLLTEPGAESVEIDLTQTEFKLLCCLMKKPDQVFSRDQLLVAAWGHDARVLERVVDVHLCSLRKKLKTYSVHIKAVPGLGYKFAKFASVRKSS